MLALKELCLSPNSQYPYISSLTGGKDNSHEGLQVRVFDGTMFRVLG